MVAAVVIVHVRDDHVAHASQINADHGQTLARAAQYLAAALLAHRAVEAGINDIGLVLPDDCPDEIVDRHEPVVRIATEKVLGSTTLAMMGVTHGIDLVRHERCHRLSPLSIRVKARVPSPAPRPIALSAAR